MRHYRIVRLIHRDFDQWAVVSSSITDEEVWDVIATCRTRAQAAVYIDDVLERNDTLRKAGLA